MPAPVALPAKSAVADAPLRTRWLGGALVVVTDRSVGSCGECGRRAGRSAPTARDVERTPRAARAARPVGQPAAVIASTTFCAVGPCVVGDRRAAGGLGRGLLALLADHVGLERLDQRRPWPGRSYCDAADVVADQHDRVLARPTSSCG